MTADTMNLETADARELYLDLLKKTLSFSLWPEPPVPISASLNEMSTIKRVLLTSVGRVASTIGLRLTVRKEVTDEQREQGNIWPGYAHTMVGRKRLDNLQSCVERALEDDVPGDLIETGVWRGGACIFMRAILAAHGVTDRRVIVADSFQGLPRPDAERYPADRRDRHYKKTFLAVSRDEVADNFRKYGLLDDQVVFLEGFFEDTLPDAPVEQLAVLRLDGDMYSSTIQALTHLYPKLSSGGFCIVDDYALHNCKKAVDDYRAEHAIDAPISQVDWTGHYWRKP